MDAHDAQRRDTLAGVRAVDEWARAHAREIARAVRIERAEVSRWKQRSVLTTVLAFVFVLGVLVFVHELGHFLAAKRVGIRVLKFQLGFNPTIVSFRRGDTEYGIGALPLGGYVKMAGENPDEARDRGRTSDEFLSKTKWERFQVLIMGPVMNIAAGASCCTPSCCTKAPRCRPTRISRRSSAIVTKARRPRSAGIKPGDRIALGRGPQRRDLGAVLRWRSAAAPNRETSVTVCCATAEQAPPC